VDFTYQMLLALEVYPPEVCEVWYRAFRHGEDPLAKPVRAKPANLS